MKNRQVDQFAVVPPGFEEICAQELTLLGIADPTPVAGGVEYCGGLRELYLANLWLRSASRVLARFATISAKDFPALFQKASRLPWGEFARPGQALQFRVTSQQSRLQHKGRIAETLEMAAHKALGSPPPDPNLPSQLVLVRLEQDRIQLSIDSSGELLHRRGYRSAQGVAPLRENLAAAILLYLGWQPDEALVDPFCGSGTFAIEAALMACHRPPGRYRAFAFQHWPGFRQGLWSLLVNEADRACRRPNGMVIVGSDQDGSALEMACANADAAGVGDLISWRQDDFAALQLPAQSGLLVANPPYGARLEDRSIAAELYRRIALQCQDEWAQWRKGLLAPSPSLLGRWGAKADKVPFRNGGIKVTLLARE